MKQTLSNPTPRDREERARRQKLVSNLEPPIAGDFFRLKGSAYEIVRAGLPGGRLTYRLAEGATGEVVTGKLTELMAAGAYYIEAPRGYQHRADRARAHALVTNEARPEQGDHFVVGESAWRVIETSPHGNFECVTTRGQRQTSSFSLDYLIQQEAYFVTEQQARTVRFMIDVAVHRADPNDTEENFRVRVPGVLEATWSGRKEIVLDMLRYLFETHGAALTEGMAPEELALFAEKLLGCADELKEHPELERAAVSLVGTREVEAER